jgi:uncharacterized protein DUF6582
MEINTTWRPFQGPTDTPRSALPDSTFAFPAERAEPLTDAAHVRSAVARFTQVHNVTDSERDVAFSNIKAAAEFYGVSVHATDWHDMIHRRDREDF